MGNVICPDIWQAIGTMISAITSIIAFGILLFQIRQINQTIKSQNHSSIYQIGLQINNLMIENIKLMPYFLGEKELKDGSDEFYKSRLICESLLDFYEYVFLEKSRVDSDLLEYYKNYIKMMYNRNILMQKYLSENENTYDSEFVKLIKSKIEND
jgi:hypothetical protein